MENLLFASFIALSLAAAFVWFTWATRARSYGIQAQKPLNGLEHETYRVPHEGRMSDADILARWAVTNYASDDMRRIRGNEWARRTPADVQVAAIRAAREAGKRLARNPKLREKVAARRALGSDGANVAVGVPMWLEEPIGGALAEAFAEGFVAECEAMGAKFHPSNRPLRFEGDEWVIRAVFVQPWALP